MGAVLGIAAIAGEAAVIAGGEATVVAGGAAVAVEGAAMTTAQLWALNVSMAWDWAQLAWFGRPDLVIMALTAIGSIIGIPVAGVAGAHAHQHHKDKDFMKNWKPEDTKTPLLSKIAHDDPLSPTVSC